MTNSHVMIIGAGAAGLMAAQTLAKKGMKVTVLEARERTGGRIYTVLDEGNAHPTEFGAEFIHGNLPVTMQLIAEGNIRTQKGGGEWWQVQQGNLLEAQEPVEHWDLFMTKLGELEDDMPLDAFLDKYFGEDEYMGTRDSARRYAAGFDTADPALASAKALYEEWNSEDQEELYLPVEGYGAVVQCLEAKCREHGCSIYTGAVATFIKWKENHVEVITADGTVYTANKLVITVPLGVLQADATQPGALTFMPELKDHIAAAAQIGMGSVIKVLLRFSTPFWTSRETAEHVGKNLEQMSFLFSKEQIGTWWTQYPRESTLLTGWVGGPAADALQEVDDANILQMAIESLASIFKMSIDELRQQLQTSRVVNWTKDIYSRGSYCYATVHTHEARKTLQEPVADTIYFAGEALYDGVQGGTVEAALASGAAVAAAIS